MATDQFIQIPITGRCGDRRVLRAWATVPADDFCKRLMRHSWCFDKDGYPSRHNTGAGKCTIYLHHVIFERYNGTLAAGLEIDHINRSKLDAMPDNLRATTHAKNIINVGKRRDNTSGYVGVSWYKQCRRWAASIQASNKRIYLGVFLTAEEAAVAVNEAYAIHHPHVSPPNTIKPGVRVAPPGSA